jgi:ABC-type dipeptide/oligopeptide/nickel transport system permease component
VAKGISWKNLLAWNKKFSGHVLDHIYQNAHIQYFPTIKEQASFLITGLIIIEMALNIQNHLCYELLQNILYANYAAATVIVLGIYLLVKTTEIAVDFFSFNKLKRYSN